MPGTSSAKTRFALLAGHDERSISLHRRVHEVAQQRAEIFALTGALRHQHRKQLLLRIDPEERSGHSAPEELAERTRERCDALLGAYGEAEAEAMAGRHQRTLNFHIRTEMIRGHQFQRLAANQPDPVERAAVEQHLAEPGVI